MLTAGFVFESVAFGPLRRNGLATNVSACRPRRLHAAAVSMAQAQAATAPIPKEKEAAASVERYLDAGLAVVVLKRGKARLFREGRNPMVFAGAVERHIPTRSGSLGDCDPVAVCDGALSCLGYGFFNPHSMFRVRLLRHFDPLSKDGETPLPWNYGKDIEARLADAVKLRQTIGIPNDETSVYRVVNGAGDRLTGLVIDRVGDTLVVSISAMWCQVYEEQILQGLSAVLPSCEDVVWRRNIERLRQDGYSEEAPSNPTVAEVEPGPPISVAAGTGRAGDGVIVSECGVKYALSRHALTDGQKTGHYADQRENRAFVREFVRHRLGPTRVLDLFCYSGGFSLNAALGSTDVSVTAVDSSTRAIDMGVENARLNGVSERVKFVHADVVKYLRGAPETEHGSYDVVIVDPPKFAPNVKALPRATPKYWRLNFAAMQMVKRGGLLCTCSCSAAMTQDRALFIETVRKAAVEHGREVKLLKTSGAAADHPLIPEMPESEYLTMCVFACM